MAPGEARLFARAIAELKRYGISPFALPKEGEAGRLRRVYRLYERLKAGSLDYDDFRHRALKAPLRLFPWPDLVVVDGFREVGPLDLRFLRRLSERVPVLLTLEVLPEGCTPHRVLEARPVARRVFRLANPVEEARYLLRALKRALAPKALGGRGLPRRTFSWWPRRSASGDSCSLRTNTAFPRGRPGARPGGDGRRGAGLRPPQPLPHGAGPPCPGLFRFGAQGAEARACRGGGPKGLGGAGGFGGGVGGLPAPAHPGPRPGGLGRGGLGGLGGGGQGGLPLPLPHGPPGGPGRAFGLVAEPPPGRGSAPGGGPGRGRPPP